MECLQGFSVNDDTAQILVLRLLSIDTLIVYAYLPQGSTSEGIETLWNLLGLLKQLYMNIIVMGDINTRMNICNDGYNTAGRFLEKALQSSQFFARLPLSEPTYRQQSSLDHVIFSKNLLGAVQANVSSWSPVTGASDHVPILVQLEMPEIQHFDCSRAIMNKEKAAAYIESSLEDKYDFSSEDFSRSIEQFSGITMACISKCSKKKSQNRFASKWIPGLFNAELRKLKRLRNKAYLRGDWNQVILLRKEFQKLLRRRSRESWKRFLMEVQNHNTGTIWSFFRSLVETGRIHLLQNAKKLQITLLKLIPSRLNLRRRWFLKKEKFKITSTL